MAPNPTSGRVIVSGNNLAKFWRLTDARMIRKHAETGIVVRVGRDQYDLWASTGNMMEHLRAMAVARTGADPQYDNVTEGAKLKRTMREVAEMKRDQLQGQLISLPEIKDSWAVLMKSIRAIVTNWPYRAQQICPHLTGPNVESLKGMTNELLQLNSIVTAGEQGPLPVAASAEDDA